MFYNTDAPFNTRYSINTDVFMSDNRAEILMNRWLSTMAITAVVKLPHARRKFDPLTVNFALSALAAVGRLLLLLQLMGITDKDKLD